MQQDAHGEEHDRLTRSAFVHMRSGALFGLLAWTMAAGLLAVYFGATQGEGGDTVRPWIVAGGWTITLCAIAGMMGMLRHLLGFLRRVNSWITAETAKDPTSTPVTRLEVKATQSGLYGSPGIEFAWGGILGAGGLAVPYLAAIFVAIGISDTAGSPHPSRVDLVLLGCALVVTLFATAVSVAPWIGLGRAGRRFRRWRSRGVDPAAAGSPTMPA